MCQWGASRNPLTRYRKSKPHPSWSQNRWSKKHLSNFSWTIVDGRKLLLELEHISNMGWLAANWYLRTILLLHPNRRISDRRSSKICVTCVLWLNDVGDRDDNLVCWSASLSRNSDENRPIMNRLGSFRVWHSIRYMTLNGRHYRPPQPLFFAATSSQPQLSTNVIDI